MNKIKRMIRRAKNNPLSKWNTFLNFINRNNRKLKRFRESQLVKDKEFLTQLKHKIKINTTKANQKTKVVITKIKQITKVVYGKTKNQVSKRKSEMAKLISIKKDERLKLAEIKTKERVEKEKIQAKARQEKEKMDEIASAQEEKKLKQVKIDQERERLKIIRQQEIEEQKRIKQQEIEEQNRIKKQEQEEHQEIEQEEIIETEELNINRKEKKQLNYEIKREKRIRRKEYIERKLGKMKSKLEKIILYIKRKIKSRRVLTLDTSMPKEITVEYAPKSYVSESFRTLRTNIQFMNANKDIKSILVTSTMPGEGKSYATANLAATFAQANKKVLIVDADMRKGRVHEIFKINKQPGLSNYLSGVAAGRGKESLKAYIQETTIDNLFVLPMGNTPPNPSELIASEKMVKLIAELTKAYDIVIFDGTPSKIVTDSVILSREVDTTLIVTGYNKTRIDDLKKVQKDIENVGGNIAGVVINSFPINTKKYASSYYYENLEGERKKVKKMYSL